MRSALLSLRNVTLKVPSKESPILDDLSLDVFDGDFIVLLGSNGSGKSSLIKSINGLTQPRSGTITWKGENLLRLSLSKRAEMIATLTQDLNLSTFSDLTVLKNCEIALQRGRRSLFSLSTKKERALIADYLFAFSPNLAGKLHTQIGTLSGGERQTLAFAMSLWNTPSLLLLDEHTSALDPLMAEKLMDLTCETATKREITTLMSTHNLDDALRFGTRLIAMKQGKIAIDISGEEKQKLAHSDLLAYYTN